jgi:hypothetical protein
MRIKTITTVAIGFAANACQIPVDVSPDERAYQPPQSPTNTRAIVGFPMAKVNRTGRNASGTYDGVLTVGDSVTLFLLRDSLPDQPVSNLKDTARTVVWSVDAWTWGPTFSPDSSIATIRPRLDGGATLIIQKSTSAVALRARIGNEQTWISGLFSCEAGECLPVQLVVPR